jgi:large subunit ribosomal protein L32
MTRDRTRDAPAERCRAGSLPRMAVPKKKQSHSRTAKRRANHRIGMPAVNACPQCHSPRRPHRVCPVCGTYAGREVVTPGAHDHDHDHDHD